MKKKSFSIRLKKLLEQNNLTLAQVAQAINTSAPSVHRWTHGGEIEYDNLRALASFLNVNWIWLRYGDEAILGLQESLVNNESVANERDIYLSKIMENEARINMALDMASISTWEWNILINDLKTSPNCEQLFDQPIEEIRTKLFPFETMDISALEVKFNNGEHMQEWDFTLPRPDGTGDRYFASRGKLIYDSQNRPLKIVGITIDITERKNSQLALQRSELMMSKVIDTIPIGLWVADQRGKIVIANPEAKRIWGGAKLVNIEEYNEYKGWFESTGKEVKADDWTLARAIKHGETSLGEVVNIKSFDGEKRSIIMSAIPLLDENNTLIGAIEVNQDITSIKSTEAALKSLGLKWSFILEQTLIGVAYYKINDDRLHANAKFAELMKCSIAELTNDRLEDLLDEASRLEFQAKLNSGGDNKSQKFTLNCKLQCKTGETTKVHLYAIRDLMPDSIFHTFVFAIEAEFD